MGDKNKEGCVFIYILLGGVPSMRGFSKAMQHCCCCDNSLELYDAICEYHKHVVNTT